MRPESERISAIERRLDDPERRADEIAVVLPQALRGSHERGEFAPAIQEPLAKIMQVAIREEPEHFADALFPVIGPAIRKAVSEAFKTLAQQLNDAIEHSLTPRGLSWRFRAWRSGVPYSHYVMQQTRPFVVEQAFLIHADSGLLIAHAQSATQSGRDKDAISAMFSALQSFVQESFTRDNKGDLETAEIGGLTVSAIHGPTSILACVIDGLPPRSLRGELREILEGIEGAHGELLRGFPGERDAEAVVGPALRKAIDLRGGGSGAPAKNATGKIKPVTVIAALLLLCLLWLIGSAILDHNRERRLAEVFADIPGLIIGTLQSDDGKVVVRGFRDPLSAEPLQLVETAGVDLNRVQLELVPILSLDPEIVLQRARSILRPPTGVSIELVDNIVQISGQADATWIEQAQQAARSIPGLEQAAFDLRAQSADPPDVAAEDDDPLDQLVAELDGSTVRFAGGARFLAEDESRINGLAMGLATLVNAASAMGYELSVRVDGYTDSQGPADLNARLRQQRASALASRLSSAISQGGDIPPSIAIGGSTDADARQAVLRVQLLRPDSQ